MTDETETTAAALMRMSVKVEMLLEENERLRRMVMELKRDGFVVEPQLTHHFTDEEGPLPDIIIQALDSVAEEGTAMYRQLYRDARKALEDADDVDPAVIAKEISAGSGQNPYWM